MLVEVILTMLIPCSVETAWHPEIKQDQIGAFAPDGREPRLTVSDVLGLSQSPGQ